MATSAASNRQFFSHPLYLAYQEVKADKRDTIYAYMNNRLVKVISETDFSKEQDALSDMIHQWTSCTLSKPITLHDVRKCIYSTEDFKKSFPLIMLSIFGPKDIGCFPAEVQQFMKENKIKRGLEGRGDLQNLFAQFEQYRDYRFKEKCRQIFTIARFYIIKLMDLPESCSYAQCYEEYRMLFAAFHSDRATFERTSEHEEYVGLLSSIKNFFGENSWRESMV